MKVPEVENEAGPRGRPTGGRDVTKNTRGSLQGGPAEVNNGWGESCLKEKRNR